MHEHHCGAHGHEIMGMEETVATLVYMHHHNEHHAEELGELAHNLEHLGKEEEALEVRKCIKEYTAANERLVAVIEKLK